MCAGIVRINAQANSLQDCIDRDDVICIQENLNNPISSDLLTACIKKGSFNIVRYLIGSKSELINQYDSTGQTAFLAAIRTRKLSMVEMLLISGADPDLPEQSGLKGTPLMYAASINNPDFVEILLKAGASVNALDANDDHALNWATYYGHIDIMKLLIENSADLNVRSKHGRAVDVSFRLWHADSVRDVFKAYYPNKLSNDEKSMVQAVIENNEKTLRKHLKKGVSANTRDQLGSSLLHIGAEKGHMNLIRILLDHGADKDILNGVGMAPLAYAARFGRGEVVNELINHGANPNAAGELYRLSPLMGAAVNGNTAIGLALLTAGAEIDLADSVNQATALHWAMFYGNNDFAKLMIDRGADYQKLCLNDAYSAYTLALAYGNTDLADYIKKVALQNNPLIGSWRIKEIHYQYPDTSYQVYMELPGRLMVSEEHYAIMYNPYGKIRDKAEKLSKLSEAEMIYGFKTMVFNSGTYVVSDSVLVTTADMAKVAGFEGGQQWYKMSIGETALKLTMYDETYPNGKKPEWYNKLQILFILEKED